MPELEGVLRALDATETESREMLAQINAPRARRRLQDREAVRAPVGGDLLRAMRLRRGFTQAEVARSMNIQQAQVAKWERSEDWPDATRLHTLCQALGARPDEVAALTTSQFRWDAGSFPSRHSRKADRAEWLSVVDGLLHQNPYDLMDLKFLSLEASLWGMRSRHDFALPLLTLTYAHHARVHLFYKQPAQAGLWADRALELIGDLDTIPENLYSGWGAAVIAAGTSAAIRQRRGDLKRALAVLEKWLPAIRNPAFRGWALSDLASYHARLNNAEAAVSISRSAIQEARATGDEDFLFRLRDHAQLLADLGHYKEALEALKESWVLITLNGDTFVRHHLLEAESLIGVGFMSEASKSFSAADARLRGDQLFYLNPQRDALRDRIV